MKRDLTTRVRQQSSLRKGRRDLSRIQACGLAWRVLLWWVDPTCRPCAGHGHPKMPDSPNINYGHNCGACHGTGRTPAERVVPHGMSDEALWLVEEIDKQCAFIFSDMAKLLAPRLTLDLD